MLRNNVGKDKIASDLSEEFGFSNRYSKEILDDFIEIIKNELLEKKILNLLNFSTFRIKFKKKRIGRNPKTNEVYDISERNVINFKASKKLTVFLNE
jgi:nucleoid DNA-binding protein